MEQQSQGEQPQGRDVRPFMDEMVERITKVASGKVIYGEPVQRDGITIIPVSRVRFGFGGGMGRKRDADEGRGVGGGAQILPVGFIVITEDSAHFEKISRPRGPMVLAAVVLAGLFVLKLWPTRRRR